MAPGVFLVWSRIDPSLRPHKGDPELFSDSVTALPNTHFAQQLRALEDQPLPEPFRHDIPFLILYQLSETAGQEDILARLVESDDSILSDGGSHHPRLYEQIECIEAEGCEGVYADIGQVVNIVTRAAPKPAKHEEFFKFHREGMVEALLQGPNFLRSRIFKQIGRDDENNPNPLSGPYLFIYEWDCEEMPWEELVTVGAKKEWRNNIEDGTIHEVMNYHPTRLSKKNKDEEESIERRKSVVQ